ncbi:uncharacterized protein PRCAT00001947001 [Priceomyces carsonii]|uniref:uncharacterized protein n=1 Tax=Priceomyces carsonii TaxID=28549 RepID=UPI002ED802BF|nr:unnamed protein product [Priceomyces carsonii]
MVRSYDRFEQEKSFGVITSNSNIVYLPPNDDDKSKLIGKAITSALEDILIWDIKTGDIVARLSDGLTPGASNAPVNLAPATVTFLLHHMETNILAAGYSDGTIKIWDIASASVVISFQGHVSAISILKFDRSGTRLVSGSSDSSIILWDLVGEEGLFKLSGHKGQITGLNFLSQDSEVLDKDELEDYILSVSKDGLIKLWDLRTRQCVETHLAHSSECWSLGVMNTQTFAVTSGNKDQVKIWTIDLSKPDTQKLVERGSFEKQSKARCNDIGFNIFRDLVLFYIQNADRTIEVYRIRSESELKKGIARRRKRLQEKDYSEEEIIQALKDSEISMMVTSFTTIRCNSKIRSCTWIKSGNRKIDIMVSLSNNQIEYYTSQIPDNLATSAVYLSKLLSIDLLGHRTDIRSMDISSDDRLLVTCSNGELKVWNLRTFKVIRNITLDSGYSLCCKFLPGDTLVLVGFKNGSLELYDLATSQLVDRIENAHQLNGTGEAIWSLDVTSDGTKILTGGNDKSVKFWKLQAGEEHIPGSNSSVPSLKLSHFQTLELNEDVLCIKVSPDSRLLAISLLNNNVQVVFLDSLKLFLTLYGHKLPVLSIDISSDSKLIITSSADKNIKIWGLDFGDCHKSIFGHQDSIMNVKFIPLSHNFFSSGKDGLIKYWDGDKFECIQKLPAHQAEVWCLSINSDGSFFVSTSHDHSIRLWQATNDQVFLEEEREKEMEEVYEDTLLESLEEQKHKETDDETDEATKVSKQATETLKAGERLMEALDIGAEDLDSIAEYENALSQYKSKKTSAPPSKPTPNSLLLALGVLGQEYVLSVISKIKPSQLDDALLVLPFSYVLKLLRFIEIWTSKEKAASNVISMSLICRVLFFIIRTNARELASQNDPHLKTQFINLKNQLAKELSGSLNQLGFNTEGLKFIKQQWKLTHESEFIDDTEQREYEEKKAVKRSFTTI